MLLRAFSSGLVLSGPSSDVSLPGSKFGTGAILISDSITRKQVILISLLHKSYHLSHGVFTVVTGVFTVVNRGDNNSTFLFPILLCF